MRRKIGQPRLIAPSLVEEGDEISVEHKPDRGITTTLRGIVAKRVDSGDTRYMMTEEGATLLAWGPKENRKVKVTLISREEPDQATMFDLPEDIEDIRKRVA